jgi:hypothetical protein
MHVFAIGIEDAFDVACVSGLSSHLFGITLRGQPSNAAIAVHPVISISFVFQASDFPGADARILGHNTPVVLRVSDDFECHFCFCHELLCLFFRKMEPLLGAASGITRARSGAIHTCGCIQTRRGEGGEFQSRQAASISAARSSGGSNAGVEWSSATRRPSAHPQSEALYSNGSPSSPGM